MSEDAPKTNLNMEMILDAQVRLIMGTVIHGIVSTMPNVPAHVVLDTIARQSASIIGGVLTADLPTTLTMRKRWKDEFTKTMDATPVPPMPQAQPSKPHGLVASHKAGLMG